MIDKMGEDFMRTVPREVRRKTGAVYTPLPLVDEMLEEARRNIDPDIVIDCGSGSGRFALSASVVFPNAKIYAVDISAEACTMCRKNARRMGVADRVTVLQEDFLDFSLPQKRGKALWIGNPPYVRHHDLSSKTKAWLADASEQLGIKASGLSGLHVYFLAKIAELWNPGDFGCLVTSAEWLDTCYGKFPRTLLSEKLGLDSLDLRDKSERQFQGTDTTALIFSFSGILDKSVILKSNGSVVGQASASALAHSERWSGFFRAPESKVSSELVPLGSIASVHRGLVTGDNAFWVRKPEDMTDVPKELSTPVVSHAREIMGSCPAQNNPETLSELIVLPENLGDLQGSERAAAERIVQEAKQRGVDKGYVASHRKRWWSIKPSEPPAIMMTYMARHAPTFVANEQKLPMLNVIHGIYPKQAMSDKAISRLVDYLNESVNVGFGRTYCGGLTKFEPREAEEIPVPPLEILEQ